MPDTDVNAAEGLRALLARAGELAGAARGPAAERLARSVVRPLTVALARLDGTGPAAGGGAEADAGELSERVWALARDATALGAAAELPAEAWEAIAGLQDLALELAGDAAEARLAELRRLTAGLPRQIRLVPNGPYLLTSVDTLTTWLGEPLQTRPAMALCRCGASSRRPFCDGSHAESGFQDGRDPDRVPDRRESYVGLQVTILDNRGICQHSGFCTDRLATVFRLGREPFVAPSGGRMDEIVRAVRDCPSGALGLAIDGREARQQADWHHSRPPAVEVSRDGPYRVTGGIPLLDGDGGEVARAQGASLEHYALCRCGHSQNKPYCSGMHWYVGFKDPVPDPDREPTIFEWCGGLPALTRLTRLFYEKHVPQDPLLAPLFADMAADHPQRVAAWLAEVFCGPKRYSQEYGGYPRMLSQHRDKALTEEMRGRWVHLILQSAWEVGMPNDPEFRSVFSSYIEWGSRLAVENSQPGGQPPPAMPMPHWDWYTAAGPPGSRVSAVAPKAEEAEPEPVLPGPDDPVRFEEHVRPLFRGRDRRSMQFAFDLWSLDDVRQHGQSILERLANGSMPCDRAWAPERIDVFRRWLDSGMRP